MLFVKKWFTVICSGSFLLSLVCTAQESVSAAEKSNEPAQAKYVFLLIGDGFGANQRTVATAALPEKLTMNEFPVIPTGTNNAQNSTTDSAASGTAIACGIKTYNGAIGVNADGAPVESLAKKLHRNGMKVGIISNSSITDATPSAHYANQLSRGMQVEIGRDMAASGFEFFGGQNPGNQDTYTALQEAGYKIINDPALYDSAVPGEKVYMNKCPTWKWQGEQDAGLTLADYLDQAIRMLDNPNGFFIMVENGFIDYSGHGNDAGWMIHEVQALDAVLKRALEFYALHPEETLIVLTADHETGRLQLLDNFDPAACSILLAQKAERSWISSTFSKFVDKNPESVTDGRAIAELEKYYGVTFDDAARKEINDALANNDTAGAASLAYKWRDSQIGIAYTSGGHSSAKILTSAIGAGSHFFTGNLENSDLPWLIGSAVLGESYGAELIKYKQEQAQLAERRNRFSANPSKLSVAPVYYNQDTVKVCGKNFDLAWPNWEGLAPCSSGNADGCDRFEINNKSDYGYYFRFAGVDPDGAYTVIRNSTLIKPAADRENFTGKELADALFMLAANKTAEFIIGTTAAGMEIKDSEVLTVEMPEFPAQKRLDITVTADVPVIDGDITDAAWQQADAKVFVDANTGNPCKDPGTIKLVADPDFETLYLLAEFQDNDKEVAGKKHDAEVWHADSFEIFITTDDAGGLWQICMNPDGIIYDRAPRVEAAWNGEYERVSRHENSKWIIEMAIPLPQFGLSAVPYMNFCRQNKPSGELSAITPNNGTFANTKAMHAVRHTK